MRAEPIAERFERHVYPDPNSGCFIWAGASKSRHGDYGAVQVGYQRNGTRRMAAAHRVAWELANGPIPPGLHVLHKCDTPCCVNPDHLFLGSNQDNATDKARKGRGRKGSALPYGVHYQRNAKGKTGRFCAYISLRGVRRHLGSFPTQEEAAQAALKARQEAYFGGSK